ncbi:MAG: hypothetical protein LBG27_08410 [Spirochaetaceae bacterium]|jgi:hypothetical protein|nr:hypothetical protein [Spirochaetaceae bacterium]
MESTNVQSREPPQSVTFEEARAFMQEIFRQLRESGTEIDRLFAVSAKQLKETQRIVGSLGNRLGDIAEPFLIPALRGKFKEFGFFFGQVSRNVEWENESQNLCMELDALLENGSQVMVVEVKAKLEKADIDNQIGRMENVRRRLARGYPAVLLCGSRDDRSKSNNRIRAQWASISSCHPARMSK